MTLQKKYQTMLGEAENAFFKRQEDLEKMEKDLKDYREETAKAICEYLVRVFSGRIEEALNPKKIEDGTITEVKKTFILGCSIQANEFNINEVDEAKTRLTYFALDPFKLEGELMKKFLKRLKEKLKQKGIEANLDMNAYNDFQVIVALSSEEN